jgi:hypothetical protein
MPRPGRRAGTALLTLLATSRFTLPAHADDLDRLTFEARRVDTDLQAHTVDLAGGVELGLDRYRLSAEHLHLRFTERGVHIEGEARVAFCPCPDPPVAFLFRGGHISRQGEITLDFPRLQLFGAPVFGLPVLWLRGPEQVGLLPPIIEYRGADGLVLGGGVHVPLPRAAEGPRALDVRFAAHANLEGLEGGLQLTTPASRLRVVAEVTDAWRIVLDAAGAVPAPDRPGLALDLAWDVDALRGGRARAGTVDLAQAAQPFDSAAAALIGRTEAGSTSLLFSTGVVGRALRGEGPLVVGPSVSSALGGPLARLGSWDASAEGMVLGNALPGSALPLARASLHAAVDTRGGPVRLRLESGARAAIADDRPTAGASIDAAIGARLAAELPLVRAYGSAPGEAPLVHWIAPALDLGGALGLERGAFFQPWGALATPGLLVAAAGLSTALGRFAGPSLRLDLRGGALTRERGSEPLLEARLRAESPIAAASVIGVAVPRASSSSAGAALLAHLRLGSFTGPALRLDLAGAGGADTRAARLLAAWTSTVPSAEPALLATAGWTLGGEAALPLSATLRGAFGGVVDARSGELLGVRARGDYRHPCGCLALGLLGSHRLGRAGTDVLFTVDLGAGPRALPR